MTEEEHQAFKAKILELHDEAQRLAMGRTARALAQAYLTAAVEGGAAYG